MPRSCACFWAYASSGVAVNDCPLAVRIVLAPFQIFMFRVAMAVAVKAWPESGLAVETPGLDLETRNETENEIEN